MNGAHGGGTGAAHRRRVTAYYESTTVLYRALWSRRAVHYGLWELGTRSHRESIENLDRRVAAQLALPRGARVLDAGCGIGGTSCYLAATRGLAVVGITLSHAQAARARRRAARLPAATPRPRFLIADYLRTGFVDAAFDGAIAIESSCHAEHKGAFLAEARRLLRPGARLVVADGFRVPGWAASEHRRYRALLDGMALPDLAAIDDFLAALAAAGFVLEQDVDLTAEILPSAHRIATLSAIGVRVCRALRLPRRWLAHGLAGLAQLPLFRERLLTYRLLVARL